VVVTAHNATGTLPALLDALRSQTLARESFELVMVDDCSSDQTGRLIAESGIATLLSTDEPLGDGARNLAVENSRAPVVAITDADCRPVPEWLEAGLSDLARL